MSEAAGKVFLFISDEFVEADVISRLAELEIAAVRGCVSGELPAESIVAGDTAFFLGGAVSQLPAVPALHVTAGGADVDGEWDRLLLGDDPGRWRRVVDRAFAYQRLVLRNRLTEKALLNRGTELEASNRRLRNLLKSVHLYSEKTCLASLAAFICTRFQAEVGGDQGFFVLFDNSGTRLFDPSCGDGFRPLDIRGDQLMHSALEKRTVMIPDLEKMESPLESLFLEGENCGSLLCLPLVNRLGSVRAAFVLLSRQPGAFPHNAVDLARIMALLAGHALHALQTEEELRLQEKINRRAGKMEAIGRLAGGVAHDFNNLLTAVLGYSELIKMETEHLPEVIELVKDLQASVSHGASLTQQLLTFSRRHKRNVQQVDPGELIREIGKMIKILLTDKIELILDLTSEKLLIDADPDQFKQLIMNLAINSRDAMECGGTFAVRTEKVRIDSGQAAGDPELKAGEFIRIIATDTGCGMDREVLSHVFEPFFTTKEQGKGTGLGLATVFGIVQHHDGVIRVKSSPGVGTEFTVYLPLSESPEVLAPSRDRIVALAGNRRKVLLVEDDLKIQNMTARILERWNLKVSKADNGIDALTQLSRNDFDVVITDVMMPKMSGDILALRVKKQYPDVKLLFISGYSSQSLTDGSYPELEESHFIQKPFGAEELAEKLLLVLGGN